MTALISVEEALKAIVANRPAPQTIDVALKDAIGLRLAEPVIARVSQPPASVSAMDGYAVRLDDVRSSETSLNVIGEAPAGRPFDGQIETGQAVRIFTGGELPPGADHIVIQEDADRSGDTVTCREAYSNPQSVRAIGIDFQKGDRIIMQGSRIFAAHIALASSANHATLSVEKPLKVAILANGDELRAPGTALKRGEIISSNPVGLSALIKSWGAEPIDLGIASDSIASIHAHMQRADGADIFLPIGGASVGDHDHMRRAFAEAGFQSIFQKIAVKPGKPTWFSRNGRTLVLGLPGNPTAAMVCAYLFLRPLLSLTDGLNLCAARLGSGLASNGPRETFLRAKAVIDRTGTLRVSPASSQDSSLIHPFLSANCFLHRPANSPALDTGDLADILLFGPIDSAGSTEDRG